LKNAANGLSSMLSEDLFASEPVFDHVSISQLSKLLGGPETEAAGIYFKSEGALSCQIMLVIPFACSLELSTILLNQKPEQTNELGTLERSALGEIGNIVISYFLNSISQFIGNSVRPSPPAVMVDMVGAMTDIIAANCGKISDEVFMIQAEFANKDRSIETSFWIIPDQQTLDLLSSMV
jgi:chemotaxis protein CheC